MKNLMILSLMVFPGLLSAAVFKCEMADGSLVYQQQECESSAMQSKLTIEKIDPEKTRLAKQKLDQELLQQQQREAETAEQLRDAKELQLQQQQLENQQRLINETKLQTQAIQENTERLENQQYSKRIYIKKPYYDGQRPKIPKTTAKSYSELPAFNSENDQHNLKRKQKVMVKQ